MMNLLGEVFLFFVMVVTLLVLLDIVSTGVVETYQKIQQLKQWWGSK